MRIRIRTAVWAALLGVLAAQVGEAARVPDRLALPGEQDTRVRDRYEQVLMRNPYQEQAFGRVYDAYFTLDGVDAWIEKLEAVAPPSAEAEVLLGRIYERQLDYGPAIAHLEAARKLGASGPDFAMLLGGLYYRLGEDKRATGLLNEALEGVTEQDARERLCQVLGNLYLRQGRREEAAAAWARLVEMNPNDVFAQTELAETYEDNRMWSEAIGVYEKIIGLSRRDPYRQCRAWRAIGQCHLREEHYQEAIAAYQAALALVAPGNWLFDDLKQRLVTVYEDIGDLEGLLGYLKTQREAAPANLELAEMMAEAHARMKEFDAAEAVYLEILERDPKRAGVYERLLSLYERLGDNDKLAATYEKLIALFPEDVDYVRRFGAAQLQAGGREAALETWRRVLGDAPGGAEYALLAGWLEGYAFTAEAIEAYRAALASEDNLEWKLRLASLQFEEGDKDAALEAWLSVAEVPEVTPEALAETASILENHDCAEEAGGFWEKALALAPGAGDYQLRLARNLMRRGQFEAALPQFEALAAQEENAYFQQLGENGVIDCYAGLGVLEDKRRAWEQALRDTPNDTELMLKLARLHTRARAPERALQIYERCVEVAPDDVNFRRTLAEAYAMMGRMDAAIETYKDLTERDRFRANVYYRALLELYLRQNQETEAVATAEKLVEAAPGDAEARRGLSQVYQRFRRMDDAMAQYRYALRLEPEEPQYHQEYGALLASMERWGEAKEAYEHMLEHARDDATRLEAVQLLAGIHLQLGAVDALLAEFRDRVRNTPKKFSAYQELAAVQRQAGMADKVTETYEAALAAADDKEEPLRELLRDAYDRQDFDRVVSTYQQLIALTGAPAAFELERMGRVQSQLGRREDALATFNRIGELAPGDAKAQQNLAQVLFEEGFADEAEAAWERSLELDPYNYAGRYQYAMQLAGMNEIETAIAQFKRILELGAGPSAPEAATPRPGQTVAPAQVQMGMPQGAVFMGNQASLPYSMLQGRQIALNQMRYLSSSGYPAGFMPGQWRGSFAEFRPNVLNQLVYLAQTSMHLDELIEEFVAQRTAHPEDRQVSMDLLQVYQAAQRLPEALALAETLAAGNESDATLQSYLAMLYQGANLPEKAAECCERLLAANPEEDAYVYQLLDLYRQSENTNAMHALIEQRLDAHPDDPGTLLMAVSAYMREDLQAKAEPLAARFREAAKGDPAMLLQLAGMYESFNQKELADAVIDEALAQDPSNASYLQQAIGVLSGRGDYERCLDLIGRLESSDPAQAQRLRFNLAYRMQQTGAFERAQSIFHDIALAPPDPRTAASQGASAQIYVPGALSSNQVNFEGVASLLSNWGIITPFPRERIESFKRLLLEAFENDPSAEFRAELERLAEAAPAEDAAAAERLRRIELQAVLLSLDVASGANDKAAAWAALLLKSGVSGVAASNVQLLIRDLAQDDAGMLEVYNSMQGLTSQQEAQVLAAKAQVYKRQGDVPKAVAQQLAALGHTSSPQAVLEAANQIRTLGDVAAARKLLEEHAASGSRNPDVLRLLADLCRQQGEHGRAWDYCKEAYETQPQAIPGRYSGYARQYMGYSSNIYASSSNPSRQSESDLRIWFSVARETNRIGELLDYFKARIEKQPGQARGYSELAALHRMNDERDAAIALYEEFLAQHPNQSAMQLELVRWYTESSNYAKAVAIYEGMLRASRSVPRNMADQMRDLYRRAGMAEELAAFDERMAAQALSPQELEEMAQRFSSDREYEKAIGMYDRLIRQYGTLRDYRMQKANVLLRMDALEGALALYRECFESSHGQNVDAATYVQLHVALGKTDALKEQIAALVEDKPGEYAACLLQFEWAKAEKRWDDAEKVVLDWDKAQNGATGMLNNLVSLARERGELLKAAEYYREFGERQGSIDYNGIAEMYRQAGDYETAMKYFTRSAAQRGSRYYMAREWLSGMLQSGRQEAAEAFYVEFRPKLAADANALESFDQNFVQEFYNGKRLKATIDAVLGDEAQPRRDLLRKALIEGYTRNFGLKLPYLEQFRKELPGDIQILDALRDMYMNFGDGARELDVLREAAGAAPLDARRQTAYAGRLVDMGFETDAIAHLRSWCAALPGDTSRLSAAADFFKARQMPRALKGAPEGLGEAEHHAWDAAMASIVTPDKSAQGPAAPPRMSPDERIEEQRKAFDVAPGLDTFRAFVQDMNRYGKQEEAEKIYVAHKDAEWMDAWRRAELDQYLRFAGKLDEADTLLDIFWDRLRLGSRNEVYQFENLCMQQQALGNALMEMLEARMADEAPDNARILEFVARMRTQRGEWDAALPHIDRLLELTPYTRQWQIQRAEMLGKLGRTDEQIEALRNMRCVRSFRDEVTDQLALARALHDAGREEEAETAVDTVRAWSQDPSTITQIAGYYQAIENYDQAIAAYESARESTDKAATDTKLVTCYFKAGRVADAIRLRLDEHLDEGTFRQMDEDLAERGFAGIDEPTLLALVESSGSDALRRAAARSFFATGNLGAVAAIFKENCGKVQNHERQQALSAYGEFLCSGADGGVDRWRAFQADPEFAHDSLVLEAAARYLIEQLRRQRNLAETNVLIQRLYEAGFKKPQAMLELAQAMQYDRENRDKTLLWCQRIIDSPDILPAQRYEAVSVLRHLNESEAAVAELRKLMEVKPSVLSHDHLGALLLDSGADVAELREVYRPFTKDDEHLAFQEARWRCARSESSDREAGAAILLGIVDSESLDGDLKFQMALMLRSFGHEAVAIEILERIVEDEQSPAYTNAVYQLREIQGQSGPDPSQTPSGGEQSGLQIQDLRLEGENAPAALPQGPR